MKAPTNIGEAEGVAALARKALTTRQQDELIAANIMSTPHGRAWYWRKLEAAHIFATDFTGEALSGAFRQGERNIGIQLHAELMRAAPDAYVLMIKENASE